MVIRDETIHFVTIRYVSRYLAHDTIFITIFTACNKCQPVPYISQPTLNLHGLTVPLDLNHWASAMNFYLLAKLAKMLKVSLAKLRPL